MSKINQGALAEGIQTVLEGSFNAETKKPVRKFPESIDLFINLKNYDTQKDKRFSGSIKLPRIARPRYRVCVIADAFHETQCQKDSVPCRNVDDLKKLHKNKKLVKKMCNEFDAFLASEALIRQLPRLIGPHMNRAGKFPSPVQQSDNLVSKVEELRSTVRFQLKKVLCLGACIGHVGMIPDDVKLNLVLAVNFLVSMLKKNWQNIKSVYIKSTMGKPYRVY